MAKKRKKGKKVKKARRKKKSKVTLILSIVALAFLVINSLYIFLARESIIGQMLQSPELAEFPDLVEIAQTTILVLAIIWLILAAIMAYTVYLLENKRGSWGILLTEGIICIVVGRIGAGVLAIISSVLYRKQNK